MQLLLVLLSLHSVGMNEKSYFIKKKNFSFQIRFLFRLYWYPMKVLYTTGVVTGYRAYDKGCGLYGFFNGLLWMLLGLNIYWLFVSNFYYESKQIYAYYFFLVYSSISFSSM